MLRVDILGNVTQAPDFAAFGRKGAKARLRLLTPEQRTEIARQAALARHSRSTKAERQEAARKAVQARWARAKAGKKARART